MFRQVAVYAFIMLFCLPLRVRAQAPVPSATPSPTAVTLGLIQPQPGQALQGKVALIGFTAIPGFISCEISFAYANNPQNTWFPILTSSQATQNGQIGEWDTSTISDGNYVLRIVVRRDNSPPVDLLVSGLRVRNYSLIETNTPTPLTPSPSPAPQDSTVTPSATSTPISPTRTPLPTNPAVITAQEMGRDMRNGGLGIFGLFALAGIYLILKRIRYRG